MTLKWLRRSLLMFGLAGILAAVHCVASAPPIPNPVLYLTGLEVFQSGGKQFIRYKYDVFNKDAYPADMFAASPNLPPCGKNTKASRTWLDFYDQSGKRLNGFCALSKPADLNGIWF